jgi:tetratricopeptide (TPR) repeat protein
LKTGWRWVMQTLRGTLLALTLIQQTATLGNSLVLQQGQKEPLPYISLPQSCGSFAEGSQKLSELLKSGMLHPSEAGFTALGLEFVRWNNYSCAVPAFEAALRMNPKTWETRYNLALALAHAGDQKRAASELGTVIQQKPDYLPARDALGSTLQSLGELDAAAEQFQAALRINPHSPSAAFGLARILHSQKKYAAEIYYLGQTLGSNPSRQLEFQARLAFAAVQDQTGHADEAIRELRRLVTAFPDSSEAHYNLANAYSGHLRYKEARPEYEQTLRLDPGNNAARLSLAKALLEIGENRVAIPVILDCVHRVPGDYEGYLVLGQAYYREGDPAKAAEQLRRALELKPDSYDGRYFLGMVLAGTGKVEEAIQQLETAEKVNHDAPAAHYELSVLYAKEKNGERSEEEAGYFQRARDKAEQARSFDLLRIKGDDFLAKGDAQDAAIAYRDAIKLNPDDPGMHYNLSLALAKLGDLAGEKQELENAVKRGPDVPDPHNQLGTLYLQKGRVADAEREFKAAIAVNPAFAQAKNNLGALYGRIGNNRAAIELFRQALRDNPEFAQAHANLGLTLAAGGNAAEAEQELREALRFDPKNSTARAGLSMLRAQRTGRRISGTKQATDY